jgi:hypothetical protein
MIFLQNFSGIVRSSPGEGDSGGDTGGGGDRGEMRVFPREGTISGRGRRRPRDSGSIKPRFLLYDDITSLRDGNEDGLGARRFRRERANDGTGLIARVGLPLFNSSGDRRSGESMLSRIQTRLPSTAKGKENALTNALSTPDKRP